MTTSVILKINICLSEKTDSYTKQLKDQVKLNQNKSAMNIGEQMLTPISIRKKHAMKIDLVSKRKT